MEILLVGGAQNTGKSQAIYRIARRLQSNGFKVTAGSLPSSFEDFMVVLKGVNINGKEISVIINSATDIEDLIRRFKGFSTLHGTYHIMISSVRDNDYYPRKEFFEIMGLNEDQDPILEIPFAKITRIRKYRSKPLKWYAEKMDKLINHTLKGAPFNLDLGSHENMH
jgi:hypothetical protein